MDISEVWEEPISFSLQNEKLPPKKSKRSFSRKPRAIDIAEFWEAPKILWSRRMSQKTRASIVDLNMTQVIEGNLLKVMSWYDNEWKFASQMVKQAVKMIAEP